MGYRTFAPKNPFKPSVRYSLQNTFLWGDIDAPSQLSQSPLPNLPDTPRSLPRRHDTRIFGPPSYTLAFLLDTLPRQLYLYAHLFLPSLYYTRVSRIFIDCQLDVREIDKCILDEGLERHRLNVPLWRPKRRHRHVEVWSPYDDLEESWHALVDSFTREWNALNIISGLLLTAIITILQIGNAGKDPLIRYTALLSMQCALMSLLFGCVYVIRFGTMRKAYKGAEWAYQADKPRSSIFWNVWVMLAMPAIWLGWSITMLMVCIGSFIWRTGTTIDDDLTPHTPHQVIPARVVASFVLALGVVYAVCIASTLHEYGETMDEAWTNRVYLWVDAVDGPGARAANVQYLGMPQEMEARYTTPGSRPSAARPLNNYLTVG